MGRLKKQKSSSDGKKMSVLLPREISLLVNILAEERGCSCNDIVVEMLQSEAKRRKKEITKVLEKIFDGEVDVSDGAVDVSPSDR